MSRLWLSLGILLTGCSFPVDSVGKQDFASQVRLIKGTWDLRHETLSDPAIDGAWTWEAGGQTGAVVFDVEDRSLVMTLQDGVKVHFEYMQTVYRETAIGSGYDVGLVITSPQGAESGVFAYNLTQGTFRFDWEGNRASGLLYREGLT